jgi:hypothetical protein
MAAMGRFPAITTGRKTPRAVARKLYENQKNLYILYSGVQLSDRRSLMTPLDKLLSWHKDWILTDENVICRGCGGRQLQSDRENIFPHVEKCARVQSSQNPWQMLDDVRVAFEESGLT